MVIFIYFKYKQQVTLQIRKNILDEADFEIFANRMPETLA
jgi:hypothetical protein